MNWLSNIAAYLRTGLKASERDRIAQGKCKDCGGERTPYDVKQHTCFACSQCSEW